MKTIPQAAEALGISVTRVRSLIALGSLDTRPNPHYPKKILITEAAIAARLKAKKRWLATRRADVRQEEEAPHDSID